MPARGHAALRPPSGAGVTAGRASSLGLALVVAIAALATLWTVRHLRPAFQRAYRLNTDLQPGRTAVGQPLSLGAPHRTGQLSPAFSPSVLVWDDQILTWASQFDIDPNLVATVMQIESCGNPQARSPAGAIGLFQVMPYHFQSWEEPFNPEVNARRGLQYLKDALRLASGEVALALAGYNGGHGQIGRPASAWPAETARYVVWGSGILHDIEANSTHNQTMADWMEAGGSSLCQRASQALLAQK